MDKGDVKIDFGKKIKLKTSFLALMKSGFMWIS